jgi:hypothetical protein
MGTINPLTVVRTTSFLHMNKSSWHFIERPCPEKQGLRRLSAVPFAY